MFILAVGNGISQIQRNPVPEYVTGTWCQFCPCGHTIINNDILPNIPQAVVLGYYVPTGSTDPFKDFNGNSIISALGFSSYPTGIVDRTSAPLSRGVWYSTMNTRNSVAPTVDLRFVKSYDPVSRELSITAYVTSLQKLSGIYKINFIITEDSLIAAQTGNTSCPGGSEYVHDHVVRSMINGHLGEQINEGSAWADNTMFTKTCSYTIPSNFRAEKCRIIIFVYKQNDPFNQGEIQQAAQFNVVDKETAISVTLGVSDGTDESRELIFGLDPSATDGIDPDFGEALLPPVPAAGNFDARFNLSAGISTLKDFRT